MLEEPSRSRPALRIARGVGTALVLGTLAYLVYLAATGTKAVPRRVTPDVPVVHLEHVIPPPPPPPPPKQKFVEQPKDKTPQDQPKTPEEPAPPAPPALATTAAGPPDAFGLQGRPDGGDYIGGPGGNGNGAGGGSMYGWYAQMLQERVKALLRKDRRLSGERYRVDVQVWLSRDGAVERTAYLGTSGSASLDQTIAEDLKARLPEPPAGLPQPIVMRLTSGP